MGIFYITVLPNILKAHKKNNHNFNISDESNNNDKHPNTTYNIR